MKQSNMAKIFKALSNEQRLNLFKMIYENQGKKVTADSSDFAEQSSQCCGLHKAFTKACNCFHLSRSTISHHFKELENAGLITCHREGQAFNCEINEDVVDSIRSFLL
jgi:ArsR family transcriptional regulator, arsenate/arsenite/antimonite-responsive transcriptional repressor